MSIFGTDPNQQAQLALAAGLLGGRGNLNSIIGQALMGGQAAFQDASMFQQRKAVGESQMRRAQFEEEQARKAAEQRERDAAMLKAQFGQLPGPTPDGSALMPKFDPMSMLGQGASLDTVSGAMGVHSAMNKAQAPVKLGSGDRLIDPSNYRTLAENPKEADAPSAVREYEFARMQGYKGTFEQWDTSRRRAGASNTSVSYGAPMAGVDDKGNPIFFQPDKGGGKPAIVPGVKPPAPKPDKPTESQSKAQAYYDQMTAATRELEKSKVDMSSLGSQVDTMLAGTPMNILASPGAQKTRQSQEQWAEAFLRFKTGAASTEAEVKRNVKTFFPQHGDSAAVVQQKRQMRAEAEKSLLQAAQPQQPKRMKFDAQGNPVN